MSDTRSFLFGFGTASNLSARAFTVHEISGATATSVHDVSYSASTEVSNAVTIGPGRYRATLIDTRVGGTSRRLTGVFDSTESWPKVLDAPLILLSAEDQSSSSSASSSSSS